MKLQHSANSQATPVTTEKSAKMIKFLVPGGEVESPRLAAAVFETATSTDSVTPARDVAALEDVPCEARIIRQTCPSHNVEPYPTWYETTPAISQLHPPYFNPISN